MSQVTLPRALLVTALELEYVAVRRHLSNLEESVHPAGTIYEKGFFPAQVCDWEVWIIEVGAGNEATAVEVERGISYINPALTLFVGVAGGLKDVELGDVVIGDKVRDFEAGKSQEEFLPRQNTYPASDRLLHLARAERKRFANSKSSQGPPFVIRIGAIATGAKVVASTKSDVYAIIRRYCSDANAVEMEGHGHMLAAHKNNVDAIVVRGISDLIDGKTSADEAGWQPRAAENAAQIAFNLLNNYQLPNWQRPAASSELTWSHVLTLMRKVHRQSENEFGPDLILTMSGPGSVAAFRRLTMSVRDVPLVAAVTFPRNSAGEHSSECERFKGLAEAEEWICLRSSRWMVFLPSIIRRFPMGTKVLIMDDRVLSGETQLMAMAELTGLGLEVRLAALLAPSQFAPKLDFLGRTEDNDYEFPWGPKSGRFA